MLINYNKFVDLNQILSQEAKIMMHIKIFDLMLCITFKIFLFNYRRLVFFVKNINHFN